MSVTWLVVETAKNQVDTSSHLVFGYFSVTAFKIYIFHFSSLAPLQSKFMNLECMIIYAMRTNLWPICGRKKRPSFWILGDAFVVWRPCRIVKRGARKWPSFHLEEWVKKSVQISSYGGHFVRIWSMKSRRWFYITYLAPYSVGLWIRTIAVGWEFWSAWLRGRNYADRSNFSTVIVE